MLPFLPDMPVVCCRDGADQGEAPHTENEAHGTQNEAGHKHIKVKVTHEHCHPTERRSPNQSSADGRKSTDSEQSSKHRRKSKHKKRSHSQSRSSDKNNKSHKTDKNLSKSHKNLTKNLKSQSSQKDSHKTIETQCSDTTVEDENVMNQKNSFKNNLSSKSCKVTEQSYSPQSIEDVSQSYNEINTSDDTPFFDDNNNQYDLDNHNDVEIRKTRIRQTQRVPDEFKNDLENCSGEDDLFHFNFSIFSKLSPLSVSSMGSPDSAILSNDYKSNLVQFAHDMHSDINVFLLSHTLSTIQIPHITINYTPRRMKKEHPEIYKKIKKRLKIPQEDLDELLLYLCQMFPGYLVGKKNVSGLVQRLEDVSDFIIKKYQASQRKKYKGKK